MGERRQLSAFFCDVVGSTELASAFDPEDWWDVLRNYHERVSDIVTSFDGHIAQYQGDGLLAYFGYPVAHEDAAERAVRAGLATLEALGESNSEVDLRHGVHLSVRIGIHTGRVVLGSTGGEGRREVLAMGETVNLASRLQAVAQPDTIVISGSTEHLVRGRFVLEDLGLQTLKGINRPIRAYRVERSTGIVARLDLPGMPELSPFVGRREELERLLACWETARAGRGQLAVVSGDPGIGKSRLVRVLRDRLGDAPHLWLEAQCSPWMESTAFFPVIELQRNVIGISGQEAPARSRERLEAALAASDLPAAEMLPLLADLHAIPRADDQTPTLSREAQRRRTLEFLVEWTLRLARARPVVLVFEDLQWVDPSTAEFLARLLERLADAPILVLFTHRTEFEPPWSADASLRLDRLAEEESQHLVHAVAARQGLSRRWVDEIASRSSGVPLYLEELTKAALDVASREGASAEDERAAELGVPPSLHDSLMARLDRLGPAKALAQLCSAIGREFSHTLIAAVAPLDAAELREQIDRLKASGLVTQTRDEPRASYRFRHALIRDEAYESLVRAKRWEHHKRIAECLEAEFKEEAAARPELVAHHFLEGREASKGIFYLLMAARRAVNASANSEAVQHAEKGLAVLHTWPESPQRTQFELGLQTLKGSALIATRGYASREVQDAFARARALAGAIGDDPRVVPVLHGLWLFHLVRSDRSPTMELAEQLRQMGETSDDDTVQMFGWTAAGIEAFFEGRLEAAVEYVDRAFAVYDPQRHAELVATYSLGTAGVARANAAASLCLLGHADRGRELVRETIDSARRSGHPFTLAGVLVMGSMPYQLSRDYETLTELSAEAHRIATEQDFPLWIGGARIGMGIAEAALGSPERGIAWTREGLAVFRSTGAQTNTPYTVSEMAEMLLRHERPEEAEEAADEGLALVETNLDGFFTPELWRVKGEAMLARGADPALARMHLEHAIELARQRRARLLELRAATALARLELRSGDPQRARETLAPVYESFTEGFDTGDHRAARELLHGLVVRT